MRKSKFIQDDLRRTYQKNFMQLLSVVNPDKYTAEEREQKKAEILKAREEHGRTGN